MGWGRVPIIFTLCADYIHQFFNEKVAGVRASTDAAQPPLFTTDPSGCEFNDFRPLMVYVITAAVQSLPNKQCSLDPPPTHFLKEHIDIMAPYLVTLINRSLTLDVFPDMFKLAYITPLLKKADLDPAAVT